MKWSNVKLIFLREARDQLRDRRTLFTIAVLPLLLYPLLGMAFMQISQFMRAHPTKVWVIGSSFLPADPPLILDDRFCMDFAAEEDGKLLKLTVDEVPPIDTTATIQEQAEKKIRGGAYDAVVYFPPNFAQRLADFRSAVGDRGAPASDAIPSPEIFYDTADDKSRIAMDRVERIVRRWRHSIVEQNLEQNRIPLEVTEPFNFVNTDVSEATSRQAAVWSKFLPFIVLIWALTGAFYPAIDLCAGEKERGTLETLLSSPAQRSEIVWGKLLTVMGFSMTTSVLNMLSMGLTGTFIIKQMESLDAAAGMEFGPPPLAAMFWLLLALIPISALFSALALAIAAFARSSKEGQYYLLPLLMIIMPLIMIPMVPSAELDLGTSLIPVSGMMMLLRALIEGQYGQALVFLPPVAVVTGVCCLLAIRWAVDQFQNESVLFRESERFGIGLWVRHLVRDRAETPTFSEALMCGVLLLLIRFFATFMAPMPDSWSSMVVLVMVTQVALIATPALLMTSVLTRSPARTLLLRRPTARALFGAVLLALLLHPSVVWLSEAIRFLYPIHEETIAQLEPFTRLVSAAPLWKVIIVLALAPAICEELAFRGFILSGLRHMGHKWAAIILSSVFFGLAHGILQQSISAALVGVLIGYIAVQTGSLFPAIAFHFTHNALALTSARVDVGLLREQPALRWLFQTTSDNQILYHAPLALAAAGLAALLLLWFKRLPYQAYEEERLQEALDHQSPEQLKPAEMKV